MLQHFGVTPFLIFDGDYLPSKATTEEDRAKRRSESRKLGMELEKAGKISQAHLEFQKAIDVTPEMARQLIDELKNCGVQYIVAPYEADAQMVYLERKGIISGILSEDSDLLVFGAQCLLTKLDQYGNCIEINKADFCAVREISLSGWSDADFRRMAILSGCDYLASINNMGLKTAYRLVRKHKSIEKIIRMLQFDGKYRVPKDYLENFYKAELTFLHQRVFCPAKKALVFHTEPDTPLDEEKVPFIGGYVEPKIAVGVANGNLNPMTKKPIFLDPRIPGASPRTPWTVSRNLPQRSTVSTDLKKGKPISEFFKPRRIPLGELDVNCFTPSPSQLEVLGRNPGPWQSDPVERPYLNRSNTDIPSTQVALDRPVTIGRALSFSSSTTHGQRPPKRPRLCADDQLDNSLPIQPEASRSRFFTQGLPTPSSSIRSAKPRRKQDDITIFSDDSIEEALLSLPDFDGFTNPTPKRGKKIPIFDDTPKPVSEPVSPSVEPTEPETADEIEDTDDTQDSQLSLPALTQSTSFTSSTGPTTPSETPVRSALSSLSRFALTPSATPTPSQVSNSSRMSKIPVYTKSGTGRNGFIQPRLTPLQRMGKIAFTAMSPMTPPITPTISKGMPFPEVANHPLQSLVADQESKQDIRATDIPLPAADENEAQLLNELVAVAEGKGSEDLIIRDSEDEDDDLFEVQNTTLPKPTLDLKKFVFSGPV
jgi:exonuclease-1